MEIPKQPWRDTIEVDIGTAVLLGVTDEQEGGSLRRIISIFGDVGQLIFAISGDGVCVLSRAEEEDLLSLGGFDVKQLKVCLESVLHAMDTMTKDLDYGTNTTV